jgi:hypothetical protein
LWDEGFHQLLVGQWDVAISTDILTHWWALVDTVPLCFDYSSYYNLSSTFISIIDGNVRWCT